MSRWSVTGLQQDRYGVRSSRLLPIEAWGLQAVFQGRYSVHPPQLIPLSAVTALPWLPVRRQGKKLNTATVWRWATKGVKAPNGSIVRLRTWKVGGMHSTTEQWLCEFFEATSLPTTEPDATPMPRTAGQRERAAARAERELQRAGI
jgi:uncharacterized protein DUF1580